MGLEQPKLLGAKGSRDSAWLPDAEVYLYIRAVSAAYPLQGDTFDMSLRGKGSIRGSQHEKIPKPSQTTMKGLAGWCDKTLIGPVCWHFETLASQEVN